MITMREKIVDEMIKDEEVQEVMNTPSIDSVTAEKEELKSQLKECRKAFETLNKRYQKLFKAYSFLLNNYIEEEDK